MVHQGASGSIDFACKDKHPSLHLAGQGLLVHEKFVTTLVKACNVLAFNLKAMKHLNPCTQFTVSV